MNATLLQACWLVMPGDFPALAICDPRPCPGDRTVDSLRHARAATERALEKLRARHVRVMEAAERYDLGRCAGYAVDNLEDVECEVASAAQARRWAVCLTDAVDEAEEEAEEDEDSIPSPEPETWSELRALSRALGDYAQALADLEVIEKRAYRRQKEVAR